METPNCSPIKKPRFSPGGESTFPRTQTPSIAKKRTWAQAQGYPGNSQSQVKRSLFKHTMKEVTQPSNNGEQGEEGQNEGPSRYEYCDYNHGTHATSSSLRPA